MAFTGAATVKQLTDKKVVIQGTLALAADASGIIGLFGDEGAGVQLPDAFNPKPTTYGGEPRSLADIIECRINITTDVTAPVPISISKGGSPFRITLHNDLAGGGATSGLLEIIVEYSPD